MLRDGCAAQPRPVAGARIRRGERRFRRGGGKRARSGEPR
ncbi:hypothetical protein DB32_002780 [Sandaracinus amylolyticus]|uniref:Uncharacterized protein n=1 Tax=Sandaracinus amylolyticus TaxID=927083 RepID=A0A0F6W286_9BACT|nr:hypothetical protein DB32_002780 [Sandaracinus amylolyticus]